MASEPPGSRLADKIKHKAYPAREAGGFVWIYMGPADDDAGVRAAGVCADAEARRSSIVKIHVPCNWAQILEGQINSAHSSSLHSSDMVPADVDAAKATDTNWLRPSTDKAPRMQAQNTSYGFRYAAIRKPIHNADTHDYVRTTVYIAPFTCLIPPNNAYNVASVIVPEDDINTAFYFIAWTDGSKPGIDQDTWRKFNCAQPGVDLTARFPQPAHIATTTTGRIATR